MDDLQKTKEELMFELIRARQLIAKLEQKNHKINQEIIQYRQTKKAILKAKENAIKLAESDCLTGLLNRRSFMKRLKGELSRAKRNGFPVSIIFTDIDHFKCINDTYGHLAGDLVLKNFAKLLVKMCRDYDFIARFGGEEFIICLPGSNCEQATLIAQRINQALGKWHVKLPQTKEAIYITSSFGVASCSGQWPETVEQLISKADRALYKAKQNGRNRVEKY